MSSQPSPQRPQGRARKRPTPPPTARAARTGLERRAGRPALARRPAVRSGWPTRPSAGARWALAAVPAPAWNGEHLSLDRTLDNDRRQSRRRVIDPEMGPPVGALAGLWGLRPACMPRTGHGASPRAERTEAAAAATRKRMRKKNSSINKSKAAGQTRQGECGGLARQITQSRESTPRLAVPSHIAVFEASRHGVGAQEHHAARVARATRRGPRKRRGGSRRFDSRAGNFLLIHPPATPYFN